MVQAFELRRHADGLVYRFQWDGAGSDRREDRAELTIRWDDAYGWAAFDPVSEALAGRHWDMLVTERGDGPPQGLWVSRKSERSYVYDLVHS